MHFSTFLVFPCMFLVVVGCGKMENNCARVAHATAVEVPDCPRDKYQHERRKQLKGCEKWTLWCSKATYHCVVNAHMNATIETCAPAVYIIGSTCVEINEGDRPIQSSRHQNAKCMKCPTKYYPSTDAYKYPECYDAVQKDGYEMLIALLAISVTFYLMAIISWIPWRKLKARERMLEIRKRKIRSIFEDSMGDCMVYSRPSSRLQRLRSSDAFTKATHTILRSFKDWLQLQYKDVRIVQTYIGTQVHSEDSMPSEEDVIVVVIDDVNVIQHYLFRDSGKTFRIVCKLWRYPSFERVVDSNHDNERGIPEKMQLKLEQCLKRNSDTLLKKHSNLEIISISAFRSRRNGEELVPGPCIALYCSCKGVVPYSEEEFPKEIDGMNTDVREGFFYLFGNDNFFKRSTDVLSPLMMGASISKKDDDNGGTLGGFVTLENGDMGFITCAHVLFDMSGQCDPSAKFDVVQPSYGYLNTNNVCGTHARSCFPTNQSNTNGCTIDAALVKLTDRVPERGLFADLTVDNLKENGYSMDNLPEYSAGNIRDSDFAGRLMLPCVKWGAKTGFTRGMLRLDGTAVRWTNESINLGNPSSQCSFIYNKQLEIQGVGGTSFALPGDSGALVFQIDPAKTEEEDHQLHCIGMVVGGTSAGKTVVTPIKPILETLKVKMHKFSQEKMDDS